MTINDRFKEIRIAKGMNQTDFGKKLAVAQTYLSQIEKGDRDLTEKILKLACLQFDVSEHWLRTGEGEMFVETSESLVDQLCEKYDLGGIGKVILDTFVELPPAQRGAILDFAGKLMIAASDQYDVIRAELLDAAPESLAARHGDASGLQEAAELYDKGAADEG